VSLQTSLMAFSARISRSSSLAPRSFKPEGIPMSAANFLIAAMDYLRLLPGSIPLFFLPLPLRYRQNSRCRPACYTFPHREGEWRCKLREEGYKSLRAGGPWNVHIQGWRYWKQYLQDIPHGPSCPLSSHPPMINGFAQVLWDKLELVFSRIINHKENLFYQIYISINYIFTTVIKI